jgi:toxin ParE1/3/4
VATRTVRFRARAAADVDAAVDHYGREGGDALALDFVEALEQSVRRLRGAPHLGSLRFSYEVGIPELRAIATKRFPYIVVYVPDVADVDVDVWRVLHDRRDIPATLADDR